MDIDRADELMPWYPHSVVAMRRRFEASYFVDAPLAPPSDGETGE